MYSLHSFTMFSTARVLSSRGTSCSYARPAARAAGLHKRALRGRCSPPLHARANGSSDYESDDWESWEDTPGVSRLGDVDGVELIKGLGQRLRGDEVRAQHRRELQLHRPPPQLV